MKKRKHVRAEKVVAIMLATSICMLLAVPVVGRIFARPPIATGDTPAERAESQARIDSVDSGAGFVLSALVVGGIAGIVISLATGLVIAFGIGPSWMARKHEGIVVVDRFGDDGQNKYFGDSIPDLPGVRYYVRVRLADGRPAEFFTNRETHRTIVAGQVFTAHIIGRRLVSIEPPKDPPGA